MKRKANNYHFNFKIYLQLLEVFTYREIKSRYKASVLGFLWIIIYPLFTAIILNIVFGMVVKVPTNKIPYFPFVLSGLIFWNFFQQGLSLAKDSFIWNRDLVLKTVFDKEVLPVSYCLSKMPDFIVNFAILLLFYVISGYHIKLVLFLVLILIIPIFLFSAGISLIVSLLNAIFRDFGRIIELVIMMLFYVTPIIYPSSIIPTNLKSLIMLNPLSQVIVFTRELFFSNIVRLDLFMTSLLFSLTFFILGIIFFRKFEKKMVDLI
ncbi:MAG: ABC transporter permease [Patescibacteria group bacterium]|nr:ABC transporter permease [Patescibacteria group bacterium]